MIGVSNDSLSSCVVHHDLINIHNVNNYFDWKIKIKKYFYFLKYYLKKTTGNCFYRHIPNRISLKWKVATRSRHIQLTILLNFGISKRVIIIVNDVIGFRRSIIFPISIIVPLRVVRSVLPFGVWNHNVFWNAATPSSSKKKKTEKNKIPDNNNAHNNLYSVLCADDVMPYFWLSRLFILSRDLQRDMPGDRTSINSMDLFPDVINDIRMQISIPQTDTA